MMKKSQTYRKNIIFLYLLVALMISVSVMAVAFYSEGLLRQIQPFYIVVVLTLIFSILVFAMDRYARAKQLTNSWLYVNLMRRNGPSKRLVFSIFLIIIIFFILILKKVFETFFTT